MSNVLLEATTRTSLGKGASRRLRRLENKVPGIIYGGDKAPLSIDLMHNKVIKALDNESIYSSVFDITLDGKVEHVVLKALQRHPYKPVIMHMDLQRVSAKDVLVKLVPLHFTNEETAKGVKAGGMVQHTLSQVEIKCQAKDLPEFIEVDLSNLGLDEAIHLTELQLPKGVQFAHAVSDTAHDHPVVSIYKPKGSVEPEAAE
jgi:large subunit ribosomal protein L25